MMKRICISGFFSRQNKESKTVEVGGTRFKSQDVVNSSQIEGGSLILVAGDQSNKSNHDYPDVWTLDQKDEFCSKNDWLRFD